MGFSQCYLAIIGLPPAAVLEKLALRPTGERQDFADAPLTCVTLPSGWFLINAEGAGHEIGSQETLSALSAGGEAIACSVEEHVMESSAQLWRNGRRVWWIGHDANKGIEHLDVQGEAPAVFEGIRADLLGKQREARGRRANVDMIFDVPVEVAKSLTGYRYDHLTPGLTGDPFEVLESLRPGASTLKPPAPRKTFLQRIFG